MAWLAGALILTYVWRVQDLYPILASLQVPIGVTLGALAWFSWKHGIKRLRTLRESPVIRGALYLFVLMVVGVPFSIYQGLSFSFIVDDHSRTVLAMLIVAAGISSFRDLERTMVAQLAGAAVFGWTVYTRYDVGPEGRLGDLPYYDANDLGLLMVVVLPICVYFLRPRSRTPILIRALALATFGLAVLTIAKSGSRGAFLGLIGMGLTLLFGFRVVPLGRRMVAIAAAVAILAVVGGDRYWEMMSTLLNPTEDYNWSGGSETGRMAIWTRGMGYMFSNPLLGVGVGCFGVAEGTLSAAAAQQAIGFGFKWSAAHNSFVQVAGELGITGLLLFLWMLGSAFAAMRRISHDRRRARRGDHAQQALAQALIASLVAFCVSGFFLSMGYGAVLYFLMAQIAVLQLIMARRTQRQATGGHGGPQGVRGGPAVPSGRLEGAPA